MHRYRFLVVETLVEVLTFEHLRDRVLRGQTDEVLGRELREPPAVEIDNRLFRAENLEDLRLVGFGVLRNLLPGQRRPRRRASRRIADHSGEIADQKDDRVTEILKMFQLAQEDRVAQVQIGCGRIKARLHLKRLTRSARAFELRAQFGFLDNLRRALLEVSQLFFDRWKVGHVVVIIATDEAAASYGLRATRKGTVVGGGHGPREAPSSRALTHTPALELNAPSSFTSFRYRPNSPKVSPGSNLFSCSAITRLRPANNFDSASTAIVFAYSSCIE